MDRFQTVGAILAFLLLFWQIAEKIPSIVRSGISFQKSIKGVCSMVRDWLRWNMYHPVITITNVGKLIVTQNKGKYDMEAMIALKFHSQDDRYDTAIDYSMFLDIYHMGHGRESTPIRLCNVTNRELWRLGRKEEKELWVRFSQTGLEAEPLLRPTTLARVLVNSVQVKGLRERSIRTTKFTVSVIWQ